MWMEKNVYLTPCDYFLDIFTLWVVFFFLLWLVANWRDRVVFCWLGSSCFDFYGNKYILPWNCCSVVFRLVTPFLFLPLIRERHKCQMSQRKGSNDLLSFLLMNCVQQTWGFLVQACDLWFMTAFAMKTKKNVASFTFAINVIYFRIHAKVNDDADLLIILEMFRSHSLWWLYRDIIIFLTRRKTKWPGAE